MWCNRAITDFEANLTSIERIQEYIELPHHEVIF